MATQEAVLTTQDIANQLNQFFKENKWQEAQEELFSDNAESIEPPGAQGLSSVRGLDAIKKKGNDWQNMIQEVHGGWSGEPIVGGNHIAVAMGVDATMKDGNRMKMEEIAVYEVRDGKIVKEQFFY